MASRWMQAKLAKIALERKRNAVPGSFRAGHTVATSDALTVAVQPLVERYTGVVTVGEVGRRLEPVGKTRRQLDTRTYGDGTRRGALVLQTWAEHEAQCAAEWPIYNR